MKKHEYGIRLEPRGKNAPTIYFKDLHDRKLFLNLLNISQMNSSIILLEEKQGES